VIGENREKLPAAEVKKVEDAIAELRSIMQDGGVEKVNAGIEKLTKASHQIAELMYRQTAGQQAGGDPAPGPTPEPARESKEGEVIDAEYVDVENKK
jgi:molecular chaperone DnaK